MNEWMKPYLKDEPWHLEEHGYEKSGVLKQATPLLPFAEGKTQKYKLSSRTAQAQNPPGSKLAITVTPPWKGAGT